MAAGAGSARPHSAIETDLEEDEHEEIIAMSLEALKAKLQQVQTEAKNLSLPSQALAHTTNQTKPMSAQF